MVGHTTNHANMQAVRQSKDPRFRNKFVTVYFLQVFWNSLTRVNFYEDDLYFKETRLYQTILKSTIIRYVIASDLPIQMYFFHHTEVKEWTQNKQGNFLKEKNQTKRALSPAQYSYELKGENQRWERMKKGILDSSDMRYLMI